MYKILILFISKKEKRMLERQISNKVRKEIVSAKQVKLYKTKI